MDYSLLIGIELNLTNYKGENKIPNSSRFNSVVSDAEPEQEDELVVRKYMSKCGKFIYHIGIIDYLQPFRIMRKLEIYYKTKILKAKANEISSINPESYASRFELFMRNNIFYNPNYKFLEFIIDAKTKNDIQLSNRFYSIGDKNDLPNIMDEDQPAVEVEDEDEELEDELVRRGEEIAKGIVEDTKASGRRRVERNTDAADYEALSRGYRQHQLIPDD
jgi:hypothetical protein